MIPSKVAADLSEGHPWVAGRGYANFGELRQRELLRIPLPRTSVNRGWFPCLTFKGPWVMLNAPVHQATTKASA
jgi:hypothetical protein